MAKFNGTTKSVPTGRNLAGGVSYDRPIQKEIASIVLNSMLNGDSYYQKEPARLQNLESLISDPANGEFVCKAAVYTRTEGRLRSISHFMAVILLENVKGSEYLRPALQKVMIRMDDATEIVSLWNQRNAGKMIPNALRRAIKHNLETRWDMYHMRKYAQPNSKVKGKDLILLCHPNPKVWNRNFNKLAMV